MNTVYKNMFSVGILLITIIGFTGVAHANHSWGGYHWARTTNPFTVQLGDNLSSSWKSYLQTTSTDWSLSSVLDTTIVSGKGGTNCRATAGRVEVCNRKYGNTGWLGIAQIWANGTHITQGTVKLNDTYFTSAKYNTAAWKNLVMCQEVGHTFGLDHQDEDFNNANLGTCMDYTNDPTPNQHPNAHDYEQLETIYAHLDTTTTLKQTTQTVPNVRGASVTEDPSTWGREIRRAADGHSAVYARDLGNDVKIYTHVFWAEPQVDDHDHEEEEAGHTH
jgi:hypothetical protein